MLIDTQRSKSSRLIYDNYKQLPLVEQNDDIKRLMKEVLEVKSQTNICQSAQPGINISDLMRFLIENKVYKEDYEIVTARILEEDVLCETAIEAIEAISAFGMFGFI